MGNSILKLIIDFTNNSYYNKLVVGNLLISRFTPEYPALLMN